MLRLIGLPAFTCSSAIGRRLVLTHAESELPEPRNDKAIRS